MVSVWTDRGIEDFYIAFSIEENFRGYCTFFCHQGLEKLCKAYLLGERASEYESLPEVKAREEVNKIAKDLGHSLEEMIKDLINKGVMAQGIMTKKYGYITGEECIQILEQGYIECRYPVPEPIHKKYPLTNKKGQRMGGWLDPLHSSEPREFAYDVGRAIIRRTEKDFNISIQRDRVDDGNWTRFRRLFFEDMQTL